MEELIKDLKAVLERNTAALEKVADAVTDGARMHEHLAGRMDKMVSVIAGAQRKVGGELGPLIDRVKDTQAALEKERREVADATGPTTRRSRTDAGSPP
jgi:hypothetical protein